jgi:hypothetical protein
MAGYTASVDAGNGGTNAVLLKGSGRVKRLFEPSVRAAATGDSLGLGSRFELEYDYVDWYGHRYVTGDDVLRVTRRNLERHVGSNRYGNEFHQFLVAVALAKLGVKTGTVDLTVFAPPGLYNDLKDNVRDQFLAHDGEVTISLKGDSKPRTWQYEQVTVWPEGIGAAACFILDDNGEVVKTDVLAGETVVLDIGVFTLDALRFTDGNFNPEALEHATWTDAGLNVHLRQPVLRAIKSQSDEFDHLTVDDVDQVIRVGLKTGDYTLRVAGYEIDLQPQIDKHRERYAGWIANNVCDGVFDGFRGIKSVILVGGGTALVESWLRQWYGDKLLNPQKHATTKKVSAVDMNAMGGLRLALMRQKQTAQ